MRTGTEIEWGGTHRGVFLKQLNRETSSKLHADQTVGQLKDPQPGIKAKDSGVCVCVCRLSDSEVLLDYPWGSGRGDVFRVWR